MKYQQPFFGFWLACVPQGSSLGPLEFLKNFYADDIFPVVHLVILFPLPEQADLR